MGGSRAAERVALIGAGRLAAALASAFAAANVALVAVAARRSGPARRVAALATGARGTTRIASAATAADTVLLAVSDRAIAEVAGELARTPGIDWTGKVVLHHAGALGVAPLEPLARVGAAVGVLHPLQCLGASRAAWRLLSGSATRIEGDARARSRARRLARRIGLVPLGRTRWDDRRREDYHAAASLVSNDVAALLADALALFRRAGIPAPVARQALCRLSRGTLALAEQEGIAAALTGPAVRGDLATLAQHARSLADVSPDTARAHALLARRLRDRTRGS